MSKVEITLPVYDSDGVQVDTTTVELTAEQIQDIVDQACNVIEIDRQLSNSVEGVSIDTLGGALGELDEALVSYSVLEPEE